MDAFDEAKQAASQDCEKLLAIHDELNRWLQTSPGQMNIAQLESRFVAIGHMMGCWNTELLVRHFRGLGRDEKKSGQQPVDSGKPWLTVAGVDTGRPGLDDETLRRLRRSIDELSGRLDAYSAMPSRELMEAEFLAIGARRSIYNVNLLLRVFDHLWIPDGLAD